MGLQNMELKNYNSKRYKTIYLTDFSMEKVINNAYLIMTFDREEFVNLYNGQALHIESRSIISIHNIFPEIRHVRNREGFIIAKRKNIKSKLKKVRFERRA